MLTITDIKNVNFRKMNLGGYRIEDVNEFIDELIVSYDQLLKDNAELTKQVEKLEQKLEAYRADEDNIRAALMNAQKLGKASIRESKHKSDIILKDATVKAERIVSNAQREVARQEEMVDSLKRQISNFKSRLMLIYREHMNLIEALPEVSEEDEERDNNRPIERTVRISDVMDIPTSIHEDNEDIIDDEDAEEDKLSFSRSSFVIPDMDDDEDEDDKAASKKSNIEDVVNPFNSFLSGQKFPVSPVSFEDDEPEEKADIKSKPEQKKKEQEPPKNADRRDNAKKSERTGDSHRQERNRKEESQRCGRSGDEQGQSRRRDRGNRRSMAVDMADREENEAPESKQRESRPPKGAQIPPQKPKRDQNSGDSQTGRLKFESSEDDNGEDIPMGMFRRRR